MYTINSDTSMNGALMMIMVVTQLSNTLCLNKINFKTLNKVIIWIRDNEHRVAIKWFECSWGTKKFSKKTPKTPISWSSCRMLPCKLLNIKHHVWFQLSLLIWQLTAPIWWREKELIFCKKEVHYFFYI